MTEASKSGLQALINKVPQPRPPREDAAPLAASPATVGPAPAPVGSDDDDLQLVPRRSPIGRQVVTLRLPNADYEALRARAYEMGTTHQSVLEVALRYYLRNTAAKS